MREIGSVADYLDFGGIVEGRFMHIAPLRDAHFGEAGATFESIAPNLRHRFWYSNAREAGATKESTAPNLRLPLGYDGFAVLDVVAVFFVFCHSSSFGCFYTHKDTNKRVK